MPSHDDWTKRPLFHLRPSLSLCKTIGHIYLDPYYRTVSQNPYTLYKPLPLPSSAEELSLSPFAEAANKDTCGTSHSSSPLSSLPPPRHLASKELKSLMSWTHQRVISLKELSCLLSLPAAGSLPETIGQVVLSSTSLLGTLTAAGVGQTTRTQTIIHVSSPNWSQIPVPLLSSCFAELITFDWLWESLYGPGNISKYKVIQTQDLYVLFHTHCLQSQIFNVSLPDLLGHPGTSGEFAEFLRITRQD